MVVIATLKPASEPIRLHRLLMCANFSSSELTRNILLYLQLLWCGRLPPLHGCFSIMTSSLPL